MFINTARVPWAVLRGAVQSDDTPLTSFKRSDWPTSNVLKLDQPPLHDANGLAIAFHGADAADEDVAYRLLGVNRTNGPIQLLLEGIATLGTQVADIDPIDLNTVITNGLWADTITVTGGLFSSPSITRVLDSAQNRICQLQFDQRWIDELYLEIDLDGGSAAAAASFYGIITGY